MHFMTDLQTSTHWSDWLYTLYQRTENNAGIVKRMEADPE
jgi:hypothetical protein